MEGKLAGVDGQTQAVAGQTELVFEIPAAGSRGAPGDFFTATMTATNQEAATSVPVAALLRSAQGDFVYVANGERLLRTAVTVGGEADGFVQITDGLYAGDRVAVKPVEMLWLTELRLAAAGGD
jgi:multidrug efflux system membrane fusion protein